MNNQNKGYVPAVKNTGELGRTYESEKYYSFKIYNDKITVLLTSANSQAKLKSTNGYYSGTDGKSIRNEKHIVIANFTIKGIQKVTQKTLYGSDTCYRLKCSHRKSLYEDYYEFVLEIPVTNLTFRNVIGIITMQVEDAFIPFPPTTSERDINIYLSTYIIDSYNHSEKADKDITEVNAFGLCKTSEGWIFKDDLDYDFKEADSYIYVNDFYKLLHNSHYAILEFYFFFFTAIFKSFINLFKLNGCLLSCKSILIAHDFKKIEDMAYLMALTSPYKEVVDIKDLSSLKQTKNRDLLRGLVYDNMHDTIVINDDSNTSSYAKTQNLSKLDEFAECNTVVLSNRYYNELPETLQSCFMSCNSSSLWQLKNFAPQEIRLIILKFTKVMSLYIMDIADDENERQHLTNSLDRQSPIFRKKLSLQRSNKTNKTTIYSYKLMISLLDRVFTKYSVNSCSTSLQVDEDLFCNEKLKFAKITDPIVIEKEFVQKLNSCIENSNVHNADDYSRSDGNNIYYLISDEVLLFKPEYFYQKFLDSHLMSQTDFRRLLSDMDILVSNMGDKLLYRMPTGDRKTYIGINAQILDEGIKNKLPKQQSNTPEWSHTKTDYNILVGKDMSGNPIYWPVGKSITNKFAVVLGNSGYGKTYWTTSVLIKELHDNGHNVLIIDNMFIHNYSVPELRKALSDDYISNEFCFFSEWVRANNYSDCSQSQAILECYSSNKNKIVVIDDYSDKELNSFLSLLISYQQECKEYEYGFEDVFVVLDKATTEDIQKNKFLTTIYNQGRKLGISMVTILQYFSGKNSENFRKKIFQAALKVTFNMNDATVGKFLNEFPDCNRAELKKDIANLNRGEAVICGEFEDLNGNINKGICYKSAEM